MLGPGTEWPRTLPAAPRGKEEEPQPEGFLRECLDSRQNYGALNNKSNPLVLKCEFSRVTGFGNS